MTINEIKSLLNSMKTLAFRLPDGQLVPEHFHVTEIGKISKHYIDCGGTIRQEEVAGFQLWSADDYNHRLHPEKLLHIIELSQEKLSLGNVPVEIEYQGVTIEKYNLDFDGHNFLLTSKFTDCLAREKCAIPETPVFVNLAGDTVAGCAPGSGCC